VTCFRSAGARIGRACVLDRPPTVGLALNVMDEITLQVQRDEESGWLVADAPDGSGGITTQGQDLRDLQEQVTEAVAAHFDDGEGRRRIRLHCRKS